MTLQEITQKFLQNQKLLTTLLGTENKTLVESSFDNTWGTGIHIASRDALVQSKWKGVGLLGKILMGIQDKQLESHSHSHPSTKDNDINIGDSQA